MSVHSITFLLIIFIMLFSACQEYEPAPDVSHISVNTEFIAYDSLFFTMDTNDIEESYNRLKSNYPAFTELYVQRILGLKDTLPQITNLIRSEVMSSLYDSVQLHFADLRSIKSEFASAFQYYAYYFPEYNIPDVYTCITEFSVASFVFLDDQNEDALGVSLDMYLGAQFPYERLGKGVPTFSQYLIRTFNKDHLVKKTMQALIQDKAGSPPDARLIDHMIHKGKQLYIIDHLMPKLADTVLFEYTPAQLEWCINNEEQIWSFLIDKDLLYSRNMSEISTLISPAPSSMGMPPESPGRTANFIGFQIVSDYMDRRDIPLRALLNDMDAQNILTESKYKGR